MDGHRDYKVFEPNDEVGRVLLSNLKAGYYYDGRYQAWRTPELDEQIRTIGTRVDLVEFLEQLGLLLPAGTEYVPWDIRAHSTR